MFAFRLHLSAPWPMMFVFCKRSDDNLGCVVSSLSRLLRRRKAPQDPSRATHFLIYAEGRMDHVRREAPILVAMALAIATALLL